MRRDRGILARILVAVFAGVAVGGCAIFGSGPAIFVPPVMSATITQFAGTPLSGPSVTVVGDFDLTGSVRVEVTWLALEKLPETSLPPVDTRSRLTFSPVSSDTVLSTGVITRAASFGANEIARQFRNDIYFGKFGKSSMMSWRSGLLAPETTIQFDLAELVRDATLTRHIVLSFFRQPIGGPQPSNAATQPNSATIAIRIDDYVQPRAESGPVQSGRAVLGQETALLEDVPVADGSAFALLVPMMLDGAHWRAIAALIEVHAAGQSDQGALAELRQNVNQSIEAARALTRPAPKDTSDLSSAIAALETSDGLRSPLLFLANQTDAAIAADFVLVADDSMLATLANETKHYALPEDRSQWTKLLGWQLDRSSLNLMAKNAARKNVPPGITSLLALYAGEAGRHADSIPEILKSVGNRQDLDLRLVAENLIYLEDNSPSARVRAFDWLKSKNKAPPGFDPLGSPRSRRAAIDNALNAPGGTP